MSKEFKIPTRKDAEQAVKTLIKWAGDDPNREGMLETPQRVAKAYRDWFSGYNEDPHEFLSRTFEEVEEKNKLTKFQAEMSKYQAEVQREVQIYQQSFSKNSAEYSSTMAKFQSELSRFQAEVAKKMQEIQAGNQLSGVYEKQADKYYSWATAEVQKFIANNEL